MKKLLLMLFLLSNVGFSLLALNEVPSSSVPSMDEKIDADMFLPLEQKLNLMGNDFVKGLRVCLKKECSIEQEKLLLNLWFSLRNKNPYLFYRALCFLLKFPVQDAGVLFFTFKSLLQRPVDTYKKIQDFKVDVTLFKTGDSFSEWREKALPEIFNALLAYIETKTPSETCLQDNLINNLVNIFNNDGENSSEIYEKASEKQLVYNEKLRKKAKELVKEYQAILSNLPDSKLSHYIDISAGLRFLTDKKKMNMALCLYIKDINEKTEYIDPLASQLSVRIENICTFLSQELNEIQYNFNVKRLSFESNNSKSVPNKLLLKIPTVMTEKTKQTFAKDIMKALADSFLYLEQVFTKLLEPLKIEGKAKEYEIMNMHQSIDKVVGRFGKLSEELPTVFCNYFLGAHPFVFQQAIKLKPAQCINNTFYPQLYVKMNYDQDIIKSFLEQADEEVSVLLSQKELEPQKIVKKEESLAYKYKEFSGGFARKWINPREL